MGVGLERLPAGGGEEDGIEREVIGGGAGDGEVAAVGWVEGAAEESDAHWVGGRDPLIAKCAMNGARHI